jgi:hypothetical protein
MVTHLEATVTLSVCTITFFLENSENDDGTYSKTAFSRSGVDQHAMSSHAGYDPFRHHHHQQHPSMLPPMHNNPHYIVNHHMMQQPPVRPVVMGMMPRQFQMQSMVRLSPESMLHTPFMYTPTANTVMVPAHPAMPPHEQVDLGYAQHHQGMERNGYFIQGHVQDGRPMYVAVQQATAPFQDMPTPAASRDTLPEAGDKDKETGFIEEIAEKRRRNADASARFRDRRRKREQDMRETCKLLEKRVTDLEHQLAQARAQLEHRDMEDSPKRKRSQSLEKDVESSESPSNESFRDTTYKRQHKLLPAPDALKRITRATSKSLLPEESMDGSTSSHFTTVSQMTVVGAFSSSSSGSDAYASPNESESDMH